MSQQINLYNAALLPKRQPLSAAAMAVALLAVVAGHAAYFAFELRQRATLEGLVAAQERHIAERRATIARLGTEFSNQGRSRVLDDEIARVESQLKARRDLLASVRSGAGGEIAGFAPVLSALARSTLSGVWLTGIRVGGQDAAANGELQLRGGALDAKLVPAYMEALKREPVLAGRAVRELRLSAHEAIPAVKPAAEPAASPVRFIEFSLTLPRSTDAGGAS